MEATNISHMDADDLIKNMEHGLISDDEVRKLMRIEIQKRIKWGTRPTQQEQLAQLMAFTKSLRCMPIATETDTSHNSKFYDTPRSFDLIVAGSTLKESAGLFTDETTTMDEANMKMMDLYCERADIKDGQTIVDLGCGPGPLVLHLAKKYKNCKVTGVTNISSQKEYILDQCKNLNLSNVEVIIGDITTMDPESTFDRVFGISLIEHFKNFELLFRMFSKWMKDDGLLFLEYLCHKSFSYHAEEPLSEDDWYHKNFLPSGTLQAVTCPLYFQDDVTVIDHWILSGNNFGRTMGECVKRIDSKIGEIKDIFMAYHGIGEEEARKLINWWRVAFIINEELFKYNNGEDWMSSHLLCKKK